MDMWEEFPHPISIYTVHSYIFIQLILWYDIRRVWCPKALLSLLSAGIVRDGSQSMQPGTYGTFWNPNAFTILKSITGIGLVWAAGILSEIGDITAFHSSDALAKYAGLTWLKNDSGDFTTEDNRVSKAGNTYLRYYLGEATNVSGDMCRKTLNFILENMLKLPSISRRAHSRLHLVNSYASFLVCWPKTNCTPAKNWTLNWILSRNNAHFQKNWFISVA